MAKSAQKLTLNPSRDIPLDRIRLSQANVRRIKNGISIEALADDIDRRGLLQSLNVRPELGDDGQETGYFEAPAGGRRYEALRLLVKRRRLSKNAPVPCIVKDAGAPVSAEEDSLAENSFREALHPLDQFRAMQTLVDKGDDVETIAAVFMVTPAVVRQRLRLASVSPKLNELYARDEMTLDQLMAFSVCEDHARQEQVWEMLEHSYNKSPAYIRARLTEKSVNASDRRARFVGLEAYLDAGGGIMRDLFEEDGGGWLTDVDLLNRLVDEKLKAEGERIASEGWTWVEVTRDLPYGFDMGLREIDRTPAQLSDAEQARVEAIQAEAEAIETEWEGEGDLPEDVEARITALDEELGALVDRPPSFDPADVAIAGAFVTFDRTGSLVIARGFVRPEDEPPVPDETGENDRPEASTGGEGDDRPSEGDDDLPPADEDEESVLKPLPDSLITELTAFRTLALRDALAKDPSTAFLAVLHAMALSTFYLGTSEGCLSVHLHNGVFASQAPGLRESPPVEAIEARHSAWKERLPASDRELWDALVALEEEDRTALFAHCASFALSALWEPASRYDGRVTAHGVERRLAHSHVLARRLGLDMVVAGWKPTVDNYLGRVTKPRILAAVTEARGEGAAGLIDHLRKPDMAREAERLLEDAGWLAEPLRTPELDEPLGGEDASGSIDGTSDAKSDDASEGDVPIAAE